MRTTLILTCILTLACGFASAQSEPTLEERMSQAEFQAAGLDKLSPAELAQLNAWLATHGNLNSQKGSARSAFYPEEAERTKVVAHIDGEFNGWRGGTTFRLDNGQVWKQSDSSRYDAGVFHSPAVEIKPMILGSWLMVVKGCGCSVRVQRIQ